jgi:hypothetical protein
LIITLAFALRSLDKHPWVAGLLLGLAFNVKYLPIIYLPYLLIRRRFVAALWFVIGIFVFAAIPAMMTGWSANSANWGTALAGMARLLGIPTSYIAVANVDPVVVGHSVSITSGVFRILGGPSTLALLACVSLAVVALAGVGAVYVRYGMPILRWPRASEQVKQRFRGVVALEWVSLIALALAFSPQTNTRHISILLLAFAPLAALLCFPVAGVSRWSALCATAIMLIGVSIPPRMELFGWAIHWRWLGGDGWSIAIALPLLFAAGLARLNARVIANMHPQTVEDGLRTPLNPIVAGM